MGLEYLFARLGGAWLRWSRAEAIRLAALGRVSFRAGPHHRARLARRRHAEHRDAVDVTRHAQFACTRNRPCSG